MPMMRFEILILDTPAGEADAYLVQPDGEPAPGILLLMDAFGLRPRIEEIAREIASHGYVVLAPNLFYRAGHAPVLPMPDLTDGEERARLFERLRPLMAQLTPRAITEDGGAYLDRLAETAPGPAAVVGYCMGARVALRIAAAHPDRVKALAGFHAGRLVTDDTDSPHRSVGELQAEVYFGHADQDPSMSAEQIAELDQAMDQAGVTHQTEVYAGADHGYTMADTPAWNEAAYNRHLENLRVLLARTLPRPGEANG